MYNNTNNINNINNESLSRGQVLLLNNLMAIYQSNNTLISQLGVNSAQTINSLLATNNRISDIVTDAFLGHRQERRSRNNNYNPGLFYFSNQDTQNRGDMDYLRMFANFLEPIEIHPTPAQIEDATRIVRFGDIVSPINDSCPISLNRFEESDSVTIIRHCNHVFNTAELNNWFSGNCRCPVCRYDIRTRNLIVTDLSNNNFIRTNNIGNPQDYHYPIHLL